MTYPPAVSALLEALVAGLTQALGHNLTGVYLCGSLALGGFDPETSDIDVLVVTERTLGDAEMKALAALHERLPPAGHSFSQEYEVYYVDRATIRRFAPWQKHLKAEPDAPLHLEEHRPNWVLERWSVRERGVTVLGPDPKTIIDPVSPAEMRKAAYDELRSRLRHWRDGSWPRKELGHRGAQAFEVQTVCRALYTLAHGDLPTKPQAIAWGLQALPEPWRGLAEWSRAYRADRTQDATKIPEVIEFLRWAAARGKIAVMLPDNVPPAVAALLDALLAGARQALGDNLLGFYLRGSLALGGFDPETSDVDLLVVTQRPVSDTEFEALAALHARMPAGHGPGEHHYEISYIDRASLKRFAPGERRHPTTGTDWAFGWAEHRDNWVLERWIVREHGVALLGPDPKTLIAPISPEDLRAAVREELRARVRDWAGGNEAPDWLLPRYYQAFEVETICRALYTLAHGELPTKPRAVAWARETLPEPWRALVQRSQAWRTDGTEDAWTVPEVMRFVLWAASQADR